MVMRKRVRRWTRDDLDRLEKIHAFITANLSEEFSLASLARQAAMNEKKLNEGFTYLFGEKLKPFILQQRMAQAHGLLLSTDDLIKSIASSCGYKDLSSFYRAFKKFYGYAPARLRNMEVQCNSKGS